MSLGRPPMKLDFPLADADLCVKCGLCLPHCPTYLDQQHEGDSPRGRIALMQGLVTGTIAPSPALEQHLDGCLSCRACEPVCPAKVPYGKLLDAGRSVLAQLRPERTRRERLIAFILTRHPPRTLLKCLLWLYQHSGTQKLIRRLAVLGKGHWARLESLLPALDSLSYPQTWKAPAAGPVRHRLRSHDHGRKVLLFTGCTGEWFDQQTLRDTQRVLERLNFSVEIPVAQTCCGALYQHAGERRQAAGFAARNIAAFAGEAPVLCSASGCGASLLDYPVTLPGEPSRSFSARVSDISGFLLRHWPEDLELAPLKQRIAIHTPCTLKNVIGDANAVIRLLSKIPQLEITELDAAQHCCGAAGTGFITHAGMADRLLQRKLDAVTAQAPDLIVSANIGCSLHLAAGLERQGIRVPVVHPVTLLAHQLRG